MVRFGLYLRCESGGRDSDGGLGDEGDAEVAAVAVLEAAMSSGTLERETIRLLAVASLRRLIVAEKRQGIGSTSARYLSALVSVGLADDSHHRVVRG